MSTLDIAHHQAALALRVRQFHARLQDQLDEALEQCGMTLRAKTTGIVQLLYQEGPCTVGHIAETLRYSRQLAMQRLNWLIENQLAVSQRDPGDRRRRLVSLTDAGRREGEMLQAFIPRLSASFADLFAETGFDLNEAIDTADRALATTPLIGRFPDA